MLAAVEEEDALAAVLVVEERSNSDHFLRWYSSTVGLHRPDMVVEVEASLEVELEEVERNSWVPFLHWYSNRVELLQPDNLVVVAEVVE